MTETATTNVFRRYDHLERLGHREVQGIELGEVYVFPKLDGTNASVFADKDGKVIAGSRNRDLREGSDNHGFRAWLQSDNPTAVKVRECLAAHPTWILYGEWLVPHSLKTYRDDSWRRFWIFDVFDSAEDHYLSYEDYGAELLVNGLDVIHPLAKFINPTAEQLWAQCMANNFLIKDGEGLGEGVVIKNYEWFNSHSRQPWAKIVRSEFKENKGKPSEFVVTNQIELAIVEEFVNPTLVGKTRAKIVADIANATGLDLTVPNTQQTIEATHRGKLIPQLLGRVFHDLVTEELWAAVKKHKLPTIDFRLLERATIKQVKTLAADLF